MTIVNLDNKTTRKLLRASKEFQSRIKNVNTSLLRFGMSEDEIAGMCLSQKISDMPGSPQPGDKTANIAMISASGSEHLMRRKHALENADTQIRTAISSLSDCQKFAIREGLVRGMKWENVSLLAAERVGDYGVRALQKHAAAGVERISKSICISKDDLEIILGDN